MHSQARLRCFGQVESMKSVMVSCALLLCFIACGDSDDSDSFDYDGAPDDASGGAMGQGPSAPPGGQTPDQSQTNLSVQDALVLPQFGAQLGQQLIQGGAYAVLIATQATGGSSPTTTGTVTLSGQSPTYESTPADALVLIVDGFEYRYAVTG